MIGETMIANIGGGAARVAQHVGGIVVLTGQVLRALIPPRIDGRELVKNLHKMGNRSVPIVALTAFFSGGLMMLQSGPFVKKLGATGLAGWAGSDGPAFGLAFGLALTTSTFLSASASRSSISRRRPARIARWTDPLVACASNTAPGR